MDGHVVWGYRAAFAEMSPRDCRQCWRRESVNSAIKRTSGSTVRSREEKPLFAEAALMIAGYVIKVQPTRDRSGGSRIKLLVLPLFRSPLACESHRELAGRA